VLIWRGLRRLECAGVMKCKVSSRLSWAGPGGLMVTEMQVILVKEVAT
jgi:hypothetical protein